MHKDDNFRLTATRAGGIARMYISLTPAELRHLSSMFHVILKQLDAMADVLTYATAALSSAAYVEPAPSASRHVTEYNTKHGAAAVAVMSYLSSRRHASRPPYTALPHECYVMSH